MKKLLVYEIKSILIYCIPSFIFTLAIGFLFALGMNFPLWFNSSLKNALTYTKILNSINLSTAIGVTYLLFLSGFTLFSFYKKMIYSPRGMIYCYYPISQIRINQVHILSSMIYGLITLILGVVSRYLGILFFLNSHNFSKAIINSFLNISCSLNGFLYSIGIILFTLIWTCLVFFMNNIIRTSYFKRKKGLFFSIFSILGVIILFSINYILISPFYSKTLSYITLIFIEISELGGIILLSNIVSYHIDLF